MKRIALIADTHIPDREDRIPDEFRGQIREADHVIHAGDFTASDTLETVRELTDGSLTAVSGSMDPTDLDVPSVATRTIGDRTFVVTHGTGGPDGFAERVVEVVEREVDRPAEAVGVAGHTHQVLDTRVREVRVLNPGSVTGAWPADRATMMTADLDAGDLAVAVHELSR